VRRVVLATIWRWTWIGTVNWPVSLSRIGSIGCGPGWGGLTDEEYFWQPVRGCWTVSRRGASLAPASLGAGEFTWDFGEAQDLEPVTTIAWRLAHLIVGFAGTNGTYFGGPPASMMSFSYAGTAREALVSSMTLMTCGPAVSAAWAMPGLPGRKARRCHQSSPLRRGSSCIRVWRSFITVPRSACCVTSICGTVPSNAIGRPGQRTPAHAAGDRIR
jgi:hypothetical protein